MIPDFFETIQAIETALPGWAWLLRSDIHGAHALRAGKTQYLCNITPKEWYDAEGVVSHARVKAHPGYAVWADSPSAAAFEAFNAAIVGESAKETN